VGERGVGIAGAVESDGEIMSGAHVLGIEVPHHPAIGMHREANATRSLHAVCHGSEVTAFLAISFPDLVKTTSKWCNRPVPRAPEATVPRSYLSAPRLL